jgi:hypothetical protein
MHRIISVFIGSPRRPQRLVEVLRGHLMRVTVLPSLYMTAIYWIVLQMSRWSGVVRLIMRGYWSLEGIEAQGYRDVAIYALVYTGASQLLPPTLRLETPPPQPIFRLSYCFLRGLSRTSVE